MKRLLTILALLISTPCFAQSPVGITFLNANGGRTTVGVSDPLPTGAGFKIASFGTPISVTTSNSTGTLPTGVPIVLATNVGANTAYCALGATATTSSQYIPAGGSFPFIVVGQTQLTCITGSSTTTINMTGGSGNAGSSGGGGSGGGGGGGAITMASGAVAAGAYSAGAGVDGWDLSVGATTAAAATAGSTGTIQAKLRLMTTQLDNINTNVQASIPAGSAVIGKVGIDQTTPGTTNLVALAANQSVNVAQMNGVTITMGNGVAGTGVQRVAIASDNTAFSVNATLGTETTKVIGTVRAQGNLGAAFDAAIGAAPPANAIQIAGLASGATGGFLKPIVVCDNSAFLDMTTATTTEIVALTSGRQIYVCSVKITAEGATAIKFVRGTGTNCGTGTTTISSNDLWIASTTSGYSRGSGLGMLFATTSGNALCVTNSAAVNNHIDVTYTVF